MSAPRVALDAHTELYETLKHPADALVRYFDHYMATGHEVVGRQRLAGYEGTSAEARAVMASWEYYTWPAKTGLDLIRLMSAPLFSAPTYQVTGEIVDAVTSMYRMTADGKPVLHASDMPSQTGFAWLDEPVTLLDFGGEPIATRALSWGPHLFSPGGWQPAKGVRITSWDDAYLAALRSPDPPLGLSSSVFVPYGKPIAAGTSDDPTRWLHCLWLFMDTEITSAVRERTERSSRRRAERAGLPRGDVTVVMLRRRHYAGEGGHRDIDWSCRWIVQGHDRHLGDYRAGGYAPHHAKPAAAGQPCAVCGVRTTHIRAYVKGPDGLPLKPSAVVYRVGR